MDFDVDQDDMLDFSGVKELSRVGDPPSFAHEVDGNVVFDFRKSSVTLTGVTIADLEQASYGWLC
jgi:hypothetical protein